MKKPTKKIHLTKKQRRFAAFPGNKAKGNGPNNYRKTRI